MKTAEERFWSRVRKTPDCWDWQGSAKANNGYGGFWFNGRLFHAHRVAWMLTHNSDHKRQEVMHLCNNKRCVNPTHLRLGSHAENMKQWFDSRSQEQSRQAAKKGHATKRLAGYAFLRRGEQHLCAKLTWKAVREIRRLAVDGNHKQLARQYGVGSSTIDDIIAGRHWKDPRYHAAVQKAIGKED